MKPIDKNLCTFYYDDDDIYVFCFFGTNDTLVMSAGVGITDMFIYRSRTDNAWEYVQQETKLFDLLHQEIFRNHRYYRVQWQDIEKEVPPFPEMPENQVAKTWKDNFQFAPENPENFQQC